MSLAEALSDLKAEVINGRNVSDVAEEIAADYALNPALLTRKFVESYGSEESVRLIEKETSPEVRIAREVARLCAKYRADPSRVEVKHHEGETYTVVCKLMDNAKYGLVAVRHSDARFVQLAWTFFL